MICKGKSDAPRVEDICKYPINHQPYIPWSLFHGKGYTLQSCSVYFYFLLFFAGLLVCCPIKLGKIEIPEKKNWNLTIAFSEIEPKLRTNTSQLTRVGSPEHLKHIRKNLCFSCKSYICRAESKYWRKRKFSFIGFVWAPVLVVGVALRSYWRSSESTIFRFSKLEPSPGIKITSKSRRDIFPEIEV